MAFLTEDEPPRGIRQPVFRNVSRIVARNANAMAYHGTNSYIVEMDGTIVLVDPGPDDENHVLDILRSTGGRIDQILISHHHSDHAGAAPAVRKMTGAQICCHHQFAPSAWVPDVRFQHGDQIAGMTVLHTPGHASDHVCFVRPDGAVFSGDHVMAWASTVVSPPNGDMAQYCASLRLLLERDDQLYLPGHGPPLPDPVPYVRRLLERRLQREGEILALLRGGVYTPSEIVDRLYSKEDARLRRAAERNVISHLQKLAQDHLVAERGAFWFGVN